MHRWIRWSWLWWECYKISLKINYFKIIGFGFECQKKFVPSNKWTLCIASDWYLLLFRISVVVLFCFNDTIFFACCYRFYIVLYCSLMRGILFQSLFFFNSLVIGYHIVTGTRNSIISQLPLNQTFNATPGFGYHFKVFVMVTETALEKLLKMNLRHAVSKL